MLHIYGIFTRSTQKSTFPKPVGTLTLTLSLSLIPTLPRNPACCEGPSTAQVAPVGRKQWRACQKKKTSVLERSPDICRCRTTAQNAALLLYGKSLCPEV